MQIPSGPGAIRLDDALFASADVCRISGVSEGTLRNWIARDTTPQLGKRFLGRIAFSLSDVLRVAAMQDLISRVVMPPATAAKVADLFVREIAKRSPGGVADANAVPRTLALAVAWVEGEPHVQLVDQNEPGGYEGFEAAWGAAHVVLPLAGLLNRVLWDAVTLLAERAGGSA